MRTRKLDEGGTSPPKPTPGVEVLDGGVSARVDEIDSDGVGAGKAVGSITVEVSGWLGKAGEEIGVAVGRAVSVLQRVGVSGEEF